MDAMMLSSSSRVRKGFTDSAALFLAVCQYPYFPKKMFKCLTQIVFRFIKCLELLRKDGNSDPKKEALNGYLRVTHPGIACGWLDLGYILFTD